MRKGPINSAAAAAMMGVFGGINHMPPPNMGGYIN